MAPKKIAGEISGPAYLLDDTYKFEFEGPLLIGNDELIVTIKGEFGATRDFQGWFKIMHGEETFEVKRREYKIDGNVEYNDECISIEPNDRFTAFLDGRLQPGSTSSAHYSTKFTMGRLPFFDGLAGEVEGGAHGLFDGISEGTIKIYFEPYNGNIDGWIIKINFIM
jgi:hypothetical protein